MFRFGSNQRGARSLHPGAKQITRYVSKPSRTFEFLERSSLAVPLSMLSCARGSCFEHPPSSNFVEESHSRLLSRRIDHGVSLTPYSGYQHVFSSLGKQRPRTDDCVVTRRRQSQSLHFTHKSTFRTQPQEPTKIRAVGTLPCLP